LSRGYWGALFPVEKQQRCEADHSPPYSAQIKNAWSCASTPSYVFMACSMIKHRDIPEYKTVVHCLLTFGKKMCSDRLNIMMPLNTEVVKRSLWGLIVAFGIVGKLVLTKS
jgi:hypothetical protein